MAGKRTAGQLFVIAVWFVSIAAWGLGGGWLARLGQLTFWLLIVTHPIEFLAKRALFRRIGGSMGHHFVQTLIFGLFYWRPLEAESEHASRGSDSR